MLGQADYPQGDADQERLRRIRRERPDLASLSDVELVAYARSLLDEVETTFQRHVETSLPASVGPAILGPLCASVDRPGTMLDLISGLGNVDSASPSTGLWTLSRQVVASAELTALFDQGPAAVERALDGASGDVKAFRDSFEEFLAASGDRGPNEWDIHALSWEASPVQALALVDRVRHSADDDSPAERHHAAGRAARAARLGDPGPAPGGRAADVRRRNARRPGVDPGPRAHQGELCDRHQRDPDDGT